MLDRLFEAARTGDRPTWTAGLSTRDPAFARRARVLFENLAGLRLSRLGVRPTGARQALPGSRQALLGPTAQVWQVTVDWALPGEPATAQASLWLTLLPGPGGVRLAGTSDGAGPDTPAEPIWWRDPVTRVDRGAVTLLLGQGQRATTWLALTARSVGAARRELPRPLAARWPDRVVVEVPGDNAGFEAVLGAAPGSYAGTAAVTRAEGPRTDAAVRIVVNPALARRPALERRLTLVHETVHVATRSGSSPAPLWAVEGLAEYVAYAAEPGGRVATERALAGALRRDGLPSQLPADGDFAAGVPGVDVAYAEAWTACRTVADHRSAAALGRFYARLDAGDPVGVAAPDTLGVDEAGLRGWWRTALDQVRTNH